MFKTRVTYCDYFLFLNSLQKKRKKGGSVVYGLPSRNIGDADFIHKEWIHQLVISPLT